MRLEATLPFQGSYDAGPVSAVEPSCIHLANHGPFDRLRDPMTLWREATLPFQGSYGQDR